MFEDNYSHILTWTFYKTIFTVNYIQKIYFKSQRLSQLKLAVKVWYFFMTHPLYLNNNKIMTNITQHVDD
ncbi:MAG: hypothetical protein Sylvanvirus7_38 [Sylvanvirus sp.]|uniref:Uncharacterized protein n=1 Tax=Sylvanvirus sp. TaxID=2487774 RepID=A0A3G5AHU1_9VIRU|nr:MAG: hypothetical protein Sylvanvirus7_38 [Sylvanvirus sp.]